MLLSKYYKKVFHKTILGAIEMADVLARVLFLTYHY